MKWRDVIAAVREYPRLREELAQARAELENRRILVEQSGSLAEAALRINCVFEAADRAAKQYLENICRTARENGEEQ